ncbi:MAG TPA: DUF5069 domain-containing protein [Clostridia bacterium]|nr:DUF5069 domain-containing protein [Clostridia bacterium]
MINYHLPDLSQHPPRSPRVRLGGFAHLPRLLDKARATVAGKLGLYEYGAMMDRHFFAFTGIDAGAFLEAIKSGKTDGEMLKWVQENSRPARQPHEILQWSDWLESIGPATATGHAWLADKITGYGPAREDVQTYCEHLDLDDYVSFGGKS